MDFTSDIEGLIRECATDLPRIVEQELSTARSVESEMGKIQLTQILENVGVARCDITPMCQDTGFPIFYVSHPIGFDTFDLLAQINSALEKTTLSVPLRSNSVDSFSQKNTNTNTGVGYPKVVYTSWDKDEIQIDLMLKGGGSENITKLYSLPYEMIGAERDLLGVEKCVLDAVNEAQGKGCPPYYIGVGVGGLTDTVISESKKVIVDGLLGDYRADELYEFNKEIKSKINSLGIGPMGLGGFTTVLDVYSRFLARHPASFFVAVSFMCWAARIRRWKKKL